MQHKNNGAWRLWGVLFIVLGALGIAAQAFNLPLDVVGIVIPFGLALTFGLIYAADRSRWWALIPAWAFIMGGTAVVMGELWPQAQVAIPLTLMAAVPFGVVFAADPRENWWALIPAYVFVAAAFIVFAADSMQWDVAGLAPLIVGLPFMVVFAADPRENWWALIPGGVLLSASAGLLMQSMTLPIGALLMIAGGVYLLLGKPRSTESHTGPEADQPRV
jgi:hypothetical protein